MANARLSQSIRESIQTESPNARLNQSFRETIFQVQVADKLQVFSIYDNHFPRIKRNFGLYQSASVAVFPTTPKMFTIVF